MRQNKGFTLIELLITVFVIGILVAFLLPNLAGMRSRARDVAKKQDAAQIKLALRMYYNDFQSYPNSIPVGSSFDNGAGTIYMASVPIVEGMTYAPRSANDDFLITIILENQGDPDAESSAQRCGVSPYPGRYYVCAD